MSENNRTRLLIAPDREAAEEAADALVETGLATAPPRVVREALAGEDDAEDAQWVLAVEPPGGAWTPELLSALDNLAAEHEGWVEAES